MAQTVSVLFSNTVIWYSLTIGFFLGSMGIGVFLCNRLFSKNKSGLALFNVEVILSFAGGLSVLWVLFAHVLFDFMKVNGLQAIGISIFLIMFFVMVVALGILTGLELPLLLRLGHERCGKNKFSNRILSADYFGSLAGGLIFPFLLVSNFELLSIGFMVALINLAIAVFVLFVFVKQNSKYIPHITKVIFVFFSAAMLPDKE